MTVEVTWEIRASSNHCYVIAFVNLPLKPLRFFFRRHCMTTDEFRPLEALWTGFLKRQFSSPTALNIHPVSNNRMTPRR